MNVLVACEESQAVTIELRKLGHRAFSCDLIECSGGHPEWHIMADCLPLLNGGCSFRTMDGVSHEQLGGWDMIIAHPPCTYLSNVSTRAFSLRCTDAKKVVARWECRTKAAIFFMQIMFAECPKVAVENPVGFLNTAYRKPDQIINPYQFAADEADTTNYVTKKTCLWLRGLPRLKTNSLKKPNNREIFGKYPSGKNRTWEDCVSRVGGGAKIRGKTFPGIAKAMAEQWAGPAK